MEPHEVPAARGRRLDAIHAALLRDPAAEIRAPRRRWTTLGVMTLLAVAVVVIASLLVYDRPAVGLSFGIRSPVTLLAALGALLLLVVGSSAIALHRSRSGLGVSAGTLVAAVVLAPAIYAAVVLPNPVHLPDAVPRWVDISPWGVRCFFIAVIVGAIALAGFTRILRRAVPVATRLRAATLGAAAGAWSGLAVFAFCPSGDQHHLLYGHVLPILVLILLGSLTLGSRLRP